jgi:hypothetical protein
MAGKSQPIIVTVSDDGLKNIDTIAEKLGKMGMAVTRVMRMTGVIAGSSPRATIAALKTVGGVSDVEEEAVAELPPPSSPVQ